MMVSFKEVLSPHQIKEYYQKGVSSEQLQQAVNEMQSKSDLQESYEQAMEERNEDPRQHSSNSYFSSQADENLIRWQLELDSILERVEHLLRGDKPTFINGHLIWEKAKGEEERTLNDFGVSEVMKILSMYLNRNTILSNYDEKTINYKVYDFGMEVADLFYCKYESMGLDNLEKRKLYPMIIRMLVDVIHSSYLRALNGGERDSLREARQVSQTEPLSPININTGGYSKQERSIINPARYIFGRYK